MYKYTLLACLALASNAYAMKMDNDSHPQEQASAKKKEHAYLEAAARALVDCSYDYYPMPHSGLRSWDEWRDQNCQHMNDSVNRCCDGGGRCCESYCCSAAGR